MSFITKLLAIPLGYIMKGCYWLANRLNLPFEYVAALFMFTLVTKIIMFPIMMKQQKSTVLMSVFTPKIKDIQIRYKNKPDKQQEEMAKLQEYGYSPTAGCLPMVISLLIMFGLVEVIYRPLSYTLNISSDLITSLSAKASELSLTLLGKEVEASDRMIETYIIQFVKNNKDAFASFFSSNLEEMQAIEAFKMNIGPVNLYEKPVFAFSLALLIPLFSVATQILSTVVSLKASSTGNDDNSQAKSVMLSTCVMFGVFAFLYPLGFSLYLGFQNLLSMLQSMILRKIYNPEEMKKQVEEMIKQKSKEKKKKKVVTYTDKETGEKIEKEVSAAESDRLRLQRARELDNELYGEE